MKPSVESKLQSLNNIYNNGSLSKSNNIAHSHNTLLHGHHNGNANMNGPNNNNNNHLRKTRIPALPKIESHESNIDVSLLDVMAVEDFLSLLKGKTESNWKDLWKETCIFTKQLKAARELLSIGSNLISNRSNRKIIDRLLDVTHILLGAERVVILEMETGGKELAVTYCKDEKALGTRISALSGIEGK